jgi:hypothetical protein
MTDGEEDTSYTTYLHGRNGQRVEVRDDVGDVAAVLAAAERLDDPADAGGDGAETGSTDVGLVSGVRTVVVTAAAALASVLGR